MKLITVNAVEWLVVSLILSVMLVGAFKSFVPRYECRTVRGNVLKGDRWTGHIVGTCAPQ